MIRVSLFILFRRADPADTAVSASDIDTVCGMVAAVPRLREALVHTPADPIPNQPYAGDGQPPPLALQLDFNEIEALEAALAMNGPLALLTDPQKLPSLAGTRLEHQAMVKRTFREANRSRQDTSVPKCTFLVAYPGEPASYSEWLSYYLKSHTAILLRFPLLEGLDVYSRIDWCCDLGWSRVNAVQRNTVVFATLGDLRGALDSPVLDELRADVKQGPPMQGGSVHYGMTTVRVNLMPHGSLR